jgi:hypothetical protein
MTPEEVDADVRSWPAVPQRPPMPQRISPPLRIPQGQSVTQRIGQMQITDLPAPGMLHAEDALRQLRMERARQAYERRFGRPVAAGASMMAQGQGAELDALLQRVKLARQSGWRPGRS